jgi:hypothetical protein
MTSSATTPARHAASVAPSPSANARSPTRARRLLLACGIVSSLLYVAINVLGAMRWQGYSSTSQTVSELFAIGAPSRSLVVPLGIAYDVLLVAFGMGVWQSAGRRRALRVTAGLLVALGALGMVWPPMHLRGAEPTLTDALHIVFAVATVLFTLVAVGAGATALGKGFLLYSIVTIVVLIVFGGLAGLEGLRLEAQLPTPWLGITERINIGGTLLWVAVLAACLLRRDGRFAT